MLKNKEVKKLLGAEALILLFCLVIGFGFQKVVYTEYKNQLIQNNSYLISALTENHPELEEEFSRAIITGSFDEQKGLEVLSKYGLDNVESLDYLNNFEKLSTNLVIYGLVFVLIVFLLLSLLYWMFVKKQWEKMHEIDVYMNKVLQGDYSLNIRDYEEGQVSLLKNDVYKLTVKLKEQSDCLNRDKLELEQTLSDISHQLRTPLTSMYVINDLLEKDDIEPTMKKEFLKKNRKLLERIEWLVTSLLKMSRLDSGSVSFQKESVLVSQLFNDALEPLQIPMELKNIQVRINNADVSVMVDVHWTTEALVNILKNAYEHMDCDGTLTIQVKDNPIYTEIHIHDTGEGIDEKDLPHIFERFYTGRAHKESIGIGLHMAKKIIEKEDGKITVTSKKGKGTTFHIIFYKNITVTKL